MTGTTARPHRCRTALVALAVAVCVLAGPARASAETYQRISGEGSSWSAGAIESMGRNIKQFGVTVDYNPSGSTSGRKNFLNGTVDFAASDIPFQFVPEDGVSAPEKPAAGSYAYIPVTAGGTAFMYNLKVGGQRVTNLRLSGENVAKIFTGVITRWNDGAIKVDNPGLALPDRAIVPVVRSDGSGSSAQFTRWMIHQHKGIWDDFCQRTGRAPKCGFTSFYPTVTGMIAQNGDLGVAGYVAQSFAEGTIGYVNYSYALGNEFPVAKVLNAAGYYTEPTPENVAVSLLKAQINYDEGSEDYLTQILDDVYTDPDPRNYQLSSYSYFILPTVTRGNFNTDKGKTLSFFANYAMCQAQQQSASLGYSPLPVNLVEASLVQIRKIPGAVAQGIDIANCNNPTFSADGTNLLAQNAPQPQACDKAGPDQCATGTGGDKKQTTVRVTAAGGAGAGGSSTGSGGTGSTAPATSGPGAAAGSTTATTSRSCDADTGACTASSAASGGTADPAGGEAFASSTVLAGSAGWGGSQLLVVVVVLLTIGLIVVPAVVWRELADRGHR